MSKAVDIADPEQELDLVRFVAFITEDQQCMQKLDPRETFWLQRDAAESSQEQAEQWAWASAPQKLAGRDWVVDKRTWCWGGRARPINDPIGAYKDVVIKMSWLPSEKVEHEANMLRHLNSKQVTDIPRLLGKLQVPSKMMHSHAQTSAILAAIVRKTSESATSGHQLAALVLECPIGHVISPSTKPLEVLQTYRDAANVVCQIAAAGVLYRNFDLANVLHVRGSSGGSTNGPSCLVIDSGSSRLV